MTPQERVEGLGRALARLVEHKGLVVRTVSRALGYNPAYLSRALRGVHPLRVELVFELLAYLGLHPQEVFSQLYPLGGEAVLKLEALAGSDAHNDEASRVLREVVARRRGEPLSGCEYRLRLAELLAATLKDAEVSQRQVSRSLGRSPGALGEALRGHAQLYFQQVFAVLDAARVDPGRVFFELFLERPPDVLRRIRQSRSVGLLEAALMRSAASQLGASLAEPREAKPLEPPQPTARHARRRSSGA